MQNLSIILLPNMMTSSITLPMEMFTAAFAFSRLESQNRRVRTPNIKLLGSSLKPITSSSGLPLTPTHLINDSLAEHDEPEIIIVPALWRHPMNTATSHPEVCTYLQQQHARGTTICAVGTGSSLIAQAGLLNHKPATTHWYYFNTMEQHYPNVKWKRQHLITQAENIFCTGSVNSVADLCTHLIQEQFNADISNKVEMQFSPEVRQSYKTQLFSAKHNTQHHDEIIAQAQHYIGDNFASLIDFPALCFNLQIANRTLQRRFKKATGFSPLQYQQIIRIENSKALLMNSNETIEGIAHLVGYSDNTQFTRIFKRHSSQTPLEYRKSVRGKLFSGE